MLIVSTLVEFQKLSAVALLVAGFSVFVLYWNILIKL